MSTLEGWPDYLLQTIDMASSSTGPIIDNNINFVPYLFISFICIGSFFSISVFMAVLNLNFKEALMNNKSKFLNIE